MGILLIVFGIVLIGSFVFLVVILIILIFINENSVIWKDIKNLEVFLVNMLCLYRFVKLVCLNWVLNVNRIMMKLIIIKLIIVVILMIEN